MTMFRIGQKVVCIDDSINPETLRFMPVKTEQMLPNRADAIAAQSREILRTIKTQLQVAGQAKRGVPQEIIEFSERR
jgi:hypothetical protein